MTQLLMTLAAYAMGVSVWLLAFIACVLVLIAAFEYAIYCSER